MRSYFVKSLLFLLLLPVSTPAGSQLAGFRPAPYVTIDPVTSTVAVGSSVVLTARISSSGPEDFLIWYAARGSFESLAVFEPSTERVRYTPPEEPGVYTVRALSVFNNQHFAEATVVVYGSEQLILDSDATMVLTGFGDSQQIDALYLDPVGNLFKVDDLDWVSSDPAAVQVESDGMVIAVADEGSAVLTGTKGELGPLVVTVSIATLDPNAVLLPKGSVLYAYGDRVLLDAAAIDPLYVGQVLVSTFEGGFLGRATVVQPYGAKVLVVVEPVGLPDAFETLQVDVRSPTVHIEETWSDTDEETASKASPLRCQVTAGEATVVTFRPGAFHFTFDVYFGTTFDLRPGMEPKVEIWLGGDATATISGTTTTVSVRENAKLDCNSERPAKSLPAIGIGPIGLGPSLTPKLGFTLAAALTGDLEFRAPDLTRSVTDIRQGFGFVGDYTYPISERVDSGLQSYYPEGKAPFAASVGLQADLTPYVAGILGVGVSVAGTTPANVKLLELRLYGYGKLRVEPPFSPSAQPYQGPIWETGVGARASLEPLTNGALFQELLRMLGIDRDLGFEILFDVRHSFNKSPELSLSTVLDNPADPSAVTINVAAKGAEGADAYFLGWPDGEPNVPPVQVGPNVVVDANGDASVTVPWPQEEQDVAGRVADGIFGAFGWPYGRAKVTIGGNSGSDCDGPDCSPTSPGGPPGGPAGPGGGYGDPDDDGSPGHPGSIGGGGIGGGGPGGGFGGGVGDGSGNNHGTSGSTGDPHVISLDGLRYNFQGAGEFILAGTAGPGGVLDPNGDLQIQVRQRQVQPGLQGAINTAVGVRMGSSTVAIYADPQPGQSNLYVDGAATTDPGGTPILLDAGGVYGGGSSYTLVWLDGSRLRVNVGYQHLDLGVYLAEARLGGIIGLMGDYDGDRANDFTTRGGTVLDPPINYYQLYDLLGESWRVPAGDRLIDPAVGGGDPTNPSFPGSFPPSTIPDDILDEAELRCEVGGVHVPGVLFSCRFDVALLLMADPVDEALIASIIAGHAASQSDIFGDDGEVEVYLVPQTAEVGSGGTADFTASVHGTAQDSVTWSATGGTFTAAGNTIHWTAPAAAATHVLTATSTADPSRSASMTVHVVETIDLGNWAMESPAGSGSWVVSADGISVVQTQNGNPTWFVGPYDYLDVHASGTFEVNGSDDDFIGFVFGYQSPLGTQCAPDPANCPLQFFLFDWKKANQNGATEGKTLDRVFGNMSAASNPQFWQHLDSPAFTVLETLYGATEGWATGVQYTFDLIYGESLVQVFLDGQLIFELTPEDVWGPGTTETFPAGRFGFYNYSQGGVTYGDFVVSGL